MSRSVTTPSNSTWQLPPLILHPFNERTSPGALLENSKAALMLSGLIPSDGADAESLRRRLLAGRYGEVRMLFFLGKDICRWLDQCDEWASGVPELEDAGIRKQSFAVLLTSNPPQPVREKLVRWGVVDHVSIFSRAIAMNTMFVEPPAFDSLTEEFLRNYHRYTDALYRCFVDSQPHGEILPDQFRFELYASGEYSRMLETQWGGELES